MDIYVDIGLSFLDVLISLVLFWAIYRGYKRGAITHAVSLLVLLVGLGVSASLSYALYGYMQERARVPLNNLPVILVFVFSVFSVIGAHYVANKVAQNVGGEPKGFVNKLLGAFVNIVKYLYMTSVVLIMLFKIDVNYDFIHEKEQARTKLYYPILNIAPSTFKLLRFDEHGPHPVPSEKPCKFRPPDDKDCNEKKYEKIPEGILNEVDEN